MGFNTNFLLSCLVIILVVPSTVNSIVFKVGDDAGWSPHIDYARWSNFLVFLVGDDLLFVYDPNTTNVLEVTSPDYSSCNTTSPLATHNTGNDTITITKYGQRYFISGNPVHCKNGLKLVIGINGDDTYTRIIRACPGCSYPYIVPKPSCCECPGCDDPLIIPRLECCDKNTSTGGATTAPTSTPAGGAAVLTPTMSPNSTSAGGDAKTRVMPPNSTTSAASQFSWNGLLVVAAIALFLY